MADLYEKGDFELKFESGKLVISVGQPDKISNVTTVPMGYVLDKLEEVIPGDQKAAFALLKGALGSV